MTVHISIFDEQPSQHLVFEDTLVLIDPVPHTAASAHPGHTSSFVPVSIVRTLMGANFYPPALFLTETSSLTWPDQSSSQAYSLCVPDESPTTIEVPWFANGYTGIVTRSEEACTVNQTDSCLYGPVFSSGVHTTFTIASTPEQDRHIYKKRYVRNRGGMSTDPSHCVAVPFVISGEDSNPIFSTASAEFPAWLGDEDKPATAPPLLSTPPLSLS